MPADDQDNSLAIDKPSQVVDRGREGEGGRLFVFEGPDGVGKTTLADMLSNHFSNMQLAHEVLSLPGREPGTVSELIYRLYHNAGSLGVKSVLPITMQVLVTAAHVEVVEARIKPLLSAGVHVILDRFWWSTWVYSTLVHVPNKTRDLMIDLEMQSWVGIKPEVVFFVLRREPLGAEAANERWPELVRLYKQIASSQSASVPVQLIVNDGNKSDAIRQVVSRISQSQTK